MSQPGKVIRIDGEVLEVLKRKASELNIPFSTENNVIRILIGLVPLSSSTHKPIKKGGSL